MPTYATIIRMENKQTVEWLKSGLAKEGKSSAGLAAALGVAPPQVTRMTQGTRRFKVDEMQAIADYLEIPLPNDGPDFGETVPVEIVYNVLQFVILNYSFIDADSEKFPKLFIDLCRRLKKDNDINIDNNANVIDFAVEQLLAASETNKHGTDE